MSTLTVTLDLPRDLLGALDVPEARALNKTGTVGTLVVAKR